MREKEIRITASVAMAIQWLTNFVHQPEGPSWCNFVFFGCIKPLPIKKVSRQEATQDQLGSWTLQREVHFFVRGKLAAKVMMIGQRSDGQQFPDKTPLTFWGIVKVEYLAVVDTNDTPEEWKEVVLEHSGLSGIWV